MDQVLKRFSESFATQTRIRIQMRASGFKLENGYVSAEFHKDGRSIGLAEDMRPGDQVYDMDFDRVDLTATPGKAWAGDVQFYLSTGRIQTDRILERVSTSEDWLGVMERTGGRITLTCANPTTATKRAGFSLRTPARFGNYPNITSYYNVIWSIFSSKAARMWVTPFNVSLSALNDPCPGVDESASEFVGGVGFLPIPTNPSAPVGPMVSIIARRGEWAPAVPNGAVMLQAGENRFDPPILLMQARGLVVQADTTGTYEATVNVQTERDV